MEDLNQQKFNQATNRHTPSCIDNLILLFLLFPTQVLACSGSTDLAYAISASSLLKNQRHSDKWRAVYYCWGLKASFIVKPAIGLGSRMFDDVITNIALFTVKLDAKQH